MKTVVCPVCKTQNEYKEVTPIPGYALLQCNKCAMVWDRSDTPLINYNETYYTNASKKYGYENYIKGMIVNKLTFRKRLAILNKLVPSKDAILDVGCALGDCLIEAKRVGWKKTVGLDISEYAYNFSKNRGLETYLGCLQNVRLPDNSFDLVMFQDVIEHDPTPSASLKEIHRILKPNGVLFIVTPNIGSGWKQLMGKYWYHYKPKEHIMYFSSKNLVSLLISEKFSNVEVKKALHIMSIDYILGRMTRYSTRLFSTLQTIFEALGLDQTPITVYTGEIEAFATKSS